MAYGKNAYKGRWKPRNPMKYKGDINNIVYRSSWELRFFNWCDSSPSVIEWSSEETVVHYKSPVDGLAHRYFIDAKIKVQDKNGAITTYLIEIKPEAFTKPPKKPSRKTKKYVDEVFMYAVNCSKWEAATKFANQRGWKFKVLTEKELGIK